ncbi:MAG: diacylglycerol kinase family protein [Clostridia bacterium]|nr:diacylglycerol kinase family protein [Clostridia bacterium]
MSFRYAIEGIISAIRSEKHLRFHIVIANLICVFAYFYGISKAEWATLILCIVAVISAELLNTAVEKAVDTATCEINQLAKLSKDASAGAVLALSIGAILVGVCLFGDFAKIGATLLHIFTDFRILIPCLMLGILDIVFLVFGGKNDR